MLTIAIITLALVAAGLVMQLMNRSAWKLAIAAVEDRIDAIESRAAGEAFSRKQAVAALSNRVADNEAMLIEITRASKSGAK